LSFSSNNDIFRTNYKLFDRELRVIKIHYFSLFVAWIFLDKHTSTMNNKTKL